MSCPWLSCLGLDFGLGFHLSLVCVSLPISFACLVIVLSLSYLSYLIFSWCVLSYSVLSCLACLVLSCLVLSGLVQFSPFLFCPQLIANGTSCTPRASTSEASPTATVRTLRKMSLDAILSQGVTVTLQTTSVATTAIDPKVNFFVSSFYMFLSLSLSSSRFL